VAEDRPVCSVDGCHKVVKTRGWCTAHYERWRRNGDPGPAGDARKRPPRVCSVEACVDGARVRGWCAKHYARWQVHGDPTYVTRDYGAERRLRHDGYVEVWRPGHPLASVTGYVSEHRLVAWDAGLLIVPNSSVHVHHKNGIKTDNRLENLEVMTGSEHNRHHVLENGFVTNQYGTWPLRNKPQPNWD
jgi:hypothetical protein